MFPHIRPCSHRRDPVLRNHHGAVINGGLTNWQNNSSAKNHIITGRAGTVFGRVGLDFGGLP
jgi:hypothetical protein